MFVGEKNKSFNREDGKYLFILFYHFFFSLTNSNMKIIN